MTKVKDQKRDGKKVPELRFPGFKGEWEEKSLGEITTKVGSGSTPKGGSATYKKRGTPLIRSQNVINGQLNLKDVVFIDDETHKNMSNSKVIPNDVLLNITGASLGRTCVVPSKFNEGNVNQHVCIIRMDSRAVPYLVHMILSKPKSLHELLKKQTGGGKEGLNFQAVRSFKLSIPNKDEQEKIAYFLTAIDKWINSFKAQKQKLEAYKKGIMQKIFTQQIRFKDDNGNDFPDWEEKKFSDIYDFGKTNSLSREKLNYKTGTIFNIHYGDIHTKYASHFNLEDEKVPRIIDTNGTSRLDRHQTVEIGDIIIADASEDYEDIGKSIEIMSTNNEIIAAGLHTILGKRKVHYLANGFMGHRLQSQKMKLRIKKIAQGAKVLGLSKKYLSNLLIEIPSFKEQQKITNFLTTIDELINDKQNQIRRANKWKKSLLQRLFA